MQSHRTSPDSNSTRSPAWPPPRSPLPPHRLAKLANALGVSTPLPAITISASLLSSSRSHLGNSPVPSNPDPAWRSVTPSTATALNLVSPAQSKYLLHVIPPAHLPHEADASVTELTPPPSFASGYHIQFRRGTLVALQSTLQAQLVLIAKEYALPSTLGIVLYIVNTSPHSRQNSPVPFPPSPLGDAGGEEPGPRLSEEIWKNIWTRVLRAEREEVIALSRTGTPNPFGLGLSVQPNGMSQSLRPLLAPTRTEQPPPLVCPITPSTSTASSVSDTRSHEKSAGASSHSEPNTPDTSRSSGHGPPDIELPGLSSPSIVPILAKVEFDIDRRKATWYEPWVRNRRMKTTDSRSGHRSDPRSCTHDPTGPVDEKRVPYDLQLVQSMQKPPFLRSQEDPDEGKLLNGRDSAPLSESPEDKIACRISAIGPDPLGDVFDADAETWAGIHAESETVRRKVNNPNVVELALDATSLSTLPEQVEDDDDDVNDVKEVQDIIRRMSRPPLNISIPDSTGPKRRSTPSTAVGKRPIPPSLNLAVKSPTHLVDETDSVDFRNKEGVSLELEQEYQRSRNHGEEKRGGTVFEDLDLGLDLGDDDEEYDENDPNDRRRSQYLMKAKLDEIERTLAQFSPQRLRTTFADDDANITHGRNHSTLPLAHLPSPVDPLPEAWPSIPYTSVAKAANSCPRPTNHPPSPPRLALNGISAGAPKAFMTASSPSPIIPTESQLRRRELEQAMYPASIPSRSIVSDSPIPLPPDPFGRHPSVYEVDALPVQSYYDPAVRSYSHDPLDFRPSISSVDDTTEPLPSATPSSRFSADSASVADLDDRTTKSTPPLVSVKGLKKLWRRSKSSSTALPEPPTPGRASFQLSSSPYPSTPTDQLTGPPFSRAIEKGSNGDAHTCQSDQEPVYSLHPPAPLLAGSRPNSPAVHLHVPAQEKSSIRKSILKSWKSVTGVGSQQLMNGSEPRRSTERSVSNETIKQRRPSILDDSIPPSPQLPEQYLSSSHVRTGSNLFEHRKSAAQSKTGPGHHSSASHDLLSMIPPAQYFDVTRMPGTAPPSQLQFPISSRDSHIESRTSIETSQFEIITPPKVHPNLTYPYMTLDHE